MNLVNIRKKLNSFLLIFAKILMFEHFAVTESEQ
jgi:hypothetical protein